MKLRQDNIKKLQREIFDVLIIGGGTVSRNDYQLAFSLDFVQRIATFASGDKQAHSGAHECGHDFYHLLTHGAILAPLPAGGTAINTAVFHCFIG